MKTARTTIAGAALAAAMLLGAAGCSGGDNGPTETPTLPPAPPTTTENPDAREAREAEAAQKVIDAYLMVDLEFLDDNGYIMVEEADRWATVEYIDARNADLEALRRGGRTFTWVEVDVLDHQVRDYTEQGSGDDLAWFIEVNVCGATRLDYQEEDGTVIDDPDDWDYGAEIVRAQWDVATEQVLLYEYERGNAEACDFGDIADGDDATTEAP